MKTIFLALALFQIPATDTVSLEWDAVPEPGIEGYNVYRSNTSGTGYAKLNAVLISGTTYDDVTAEEGRSYFYVATAVRIGANDSHLESGFSNELKVDVPWITPPSPPGNLREPVQVGWLNILRWDRADRATGYKVDFRLNGEWRYQAVTPLTSYWFWARPNGPPRQISVQSWLIGREGAVFSERAVISR